MTNDIEYFVVGLIVLILFTFLNPIKILMPESVNTMLILGLILSFTVFAAIVFKEKASDERELSHIHIAGRISYIAGTLVLTLGVVYQAFNHEIDSWLLLGLFVMVLSKLITRIYFHHKR